MERFKFLPKTKINDLPKTSGVYAFKDKNKLIYIGKAINIQGRVKNHFNQPSYRDNLYIQKVDEIGYFETNSEIEVNISELSYCSHVRIPVKCDNCGIEKTLTYQDYNIKIKFDGKYYCNNKECINKKREMIINDKYDCKNVFQLESVKEKMKETNIEKYGCENPHQNEKIKKKAEKTNIKRYGCKNPFQNEECKEKSKQTNLKKYGVTITYKQE